MEKIITTFFFLSLIVSTSAQTFSTIQFSIGQLNGTPELHEDEDWIFRSFPEFLSGKKGLYAEGLVFIALKPKFSMGAGIHFSKLGFNHLVTGIRLGEDIINGTTTSFSKDVSLRNIGIPVQMRYDIFDKKIKLQLNTGAVALKTFTSDSKTEVTGAGANDPVFTDQELGEIADIKGISFSPHIGLDISYPITENIFIKLGGRYQWFLFLEKDYYENAEGNINTKGIYIGFEHRIK